jgi:hypothetical protein
LGLLTDNEFTKILGWPGYRVYHHEIDEKVRRTFVLADFMHFGATTKRPVTVMVSAQK